MLIREFLCVLDHGLMLFHIKFPHHEAETDDFLRSSLISALHSFVTQVEEDTIDALQMTNVTFMFKKRDELIFMLALDSAINPMWCEAEFESLIHEFLTTFPEAQWQREIILNLRIFDDFKDVVDHRLFMLNKRLELGTILLSERLITENDFLETDFEVLGSVVGQRLLQQRQFQFFDALQQEHNILIIVDEILDSLDGNHIHRETLSYRIECDTCLLCRTPSDCFFETFLDTLLTHLHFETKISLCGRSRTVSCKNLLIIQS
ncbi:MAG: hypothetical protein JSV04_15485 [Candidatus Heimdallarchaeota archaeon]|nr:MAG: hypothetical protein JSV04_15485 [Candidatus Heimdallarchaeota archaeon]